MSHTTTRREAILQAQGFLQTNPLFLDTETTGLGPQAEIVEIGIVDDTGADIFSSLVRPRGYMDADAARVHGITDAMLIGAPSWTEVWHSALAVLEDRQVGVYNAEFDLRMLKQTNSRAWLSWTLLDENFFCLMKLYARFHGDWDSRRGSFRYQSLDKAGQQCGISLPNAHRAVDDARLARALLHYMADQR